MRIPKVEPPSRASADGPARPWGSPPADPGSDKPTSQLPRRRFGRNSLMSVLFAVLILALWGGRAYQDLSSPSVWAYWKDLYFSPSLTSSVVQIGMNGREVPALAIKGEIGAAAASWFREKLDEAKLVPGDVVLMSSPGGRLDQALIMGEVIRSRGLTTMVGTADSKGSVRASYCASACVLAYAGGKSREVFPGSLLGVHQFTREIPKDGESRRDLVADTQKTTGMILEYMTRMGVSPSILQAMSATRDIRWLKQDEVFDLKLATDRYRKG